MASQVVEDQCTQQGQRDRHHPVGKVGTDAENLEHCSIQDERRRDQVDVRVEDRVRQGMVRQARRIEEIVTVHHLVATPPQQRRDRRDHHHD